MAQVPDWQGALRKTYRESMNRLISIHLTCGVVSILILQTQAVYLEMHIVQALMKIQSILGVSEKFGWKA